MGSCSGYVPKYCPGQRHICKPVIEVEYFIIEHGVEVLQHWYCLYIKFIHDVNELYKCLYFKVSRVMQSLYAVCKNQIMKMKKKIC